MNTQQIQNQITNEPENTSGEVKSQEPEKSLAEVLYLAIMFQPDREDAKLKYPFSSLPPEEQQECEYAKNVLLAEYERRTGLLTVLEAARTILQPQRERDWEPDHRGRPHLAAQSLVAVIDATITKAKKAQS